MAKRILIIEDNRDLATLLESHLMDLAFQVDLAFDGKAGLVKAESIPFDLVILDLMLPYMDGLEVCRRLRARPPYTPLIILTAKSKEMDRVLGLEMGADDYVTKPFSIRELLARIKSIFRRVDQLKHNNPQTIDAPIHAGALEIDPIRRHVQIESQPVHLTSKEFDLLFHFAQNPGKVYNRSQLLDFVWGYGYDGYAHTVNSHINRLRAKIETNPSNPVYILTVWGVGYKFAEELSA